MLMTCKLPDHAIVVEALLEGFVLACQVIIESGLAPPDPRDSNVIYQQEPVGEEDWKLPQNVIRDGWGDCEDLAGWRAAGLRITGEDTGARVVVTKTGPGKLHAVVMRSDGRMDDPSRELRNRQRAMLGISAADAGITSKPRPGADKLVMTPRGKQTRADILRRKRAMQPTKREPTVLKRTYNTELRAQRAQEEREDKAQDAADKQLERELQTQQREDAREEARWAAEDARAARQQAAAAAAAPAAAYGASPFGGGGAAPGNAYQAAYGFDPYEGADDDLWVDDQEDDDGG